MKLSIIIPTYNRLWCLPEVLASCPRDPAIEIIVVDDGSTDGSWAWLEDQPGIHAVRQDNWGKPAAVNHGFALARGRYVKFVDSDDLLLPDAVLVQLDQAIAAEADVAVAGYLARYEATGVEVPHPWVDCGDFLAQQLGECDSSHYSAYLFRREFLAQIRHRPEFAFRDDRMFVIECALDQPRVVALDRPTLVHRHHQRGRIQFQRGSVAVVTNWQERRMWEKAVALLEARGLLTPRRARAMSTNLWELATRTGAYNLTEAREILAMLHRLNPDFRPGRAGRDRLYRALGFAPAQRLVNALRGLRNVLR